MVTGQHIGSPFIFKVTLELYLVWFNTSCTFYRLDCQVSCICSSDTGCMDTSILICQQKELVAYVQCFHWHIISTSKRILLSNYQFTVTMLCCSQWKSTFSFCWPNHGTI